MSEAKKKALYETRVKLGKCEEDQDESAAHDAAILSEMKRLELSGTAGNVLQPLDEVSAQLPTQIQSSRRARCGA